MEDLEICPLLGYACRYWYIHTKAILPENEKPRDSVLRLFLLDRVFLSWLRVHQLRDDEDYRFQSLTDNATPLHLDAHMGLETVVQVLLEKGANVDAETGEGETALQLSAAKGHEVIAKLLLDKGSDVNAKTVVKTTALHLANESGHEAVVRLLLDEGAEVDPRGLIRRRC